MNSGAWWATVQRGGKKCEVHGLAQGFIFPSCTLVSILKYI